MMYEMNCGKKEQSLIGTTENLLCCVIVLIFFLPDKGDKDCPSFQMQGFIRKRDYYRWEAAAVL